MANVTVSGTWTITMEASKEVADLYAKRRVCIARRAGSHSKDTRYKYSKEIEEISEKIDTILINLIKENSDLLELTFCKDEIEEG